MIKNMNKMKKKFMQGSDHRIRKKARGGCVFAPISAPTKEDDTDGGNNKQSNTASYGSA